MIRAEIRVAKNYSLPIFNDGTAWYDIIDTTSGAVLCIHRFAMPNPGGPLDLEEYWAAQRIIAEAIAHALFAAGEERVAHIVKARNHAKAILDKVTSKVSE